MLSACCIRPANPVQVSTSFSQFSYMRTASRAWHSCSRRCNRHSQLTRDTVANFSEWDFISCRVRELDRRFRGSERGECAHSQWVESRWTYWESYQDSFYTVDSRIACRVSVLILRPVRSAKLFPSSICPCLASSVGVFKVIPTPRTVNWIVFESIRDSWSCHSDHTAQKSLSNSDGNIKGFDGFDLAVSRRNEPPTRSC